MYQGPETNLHLGSLFIVVGGWSRRLQLKITISKVTKKSNTRVSSLSRQDVVVARCQGLIPYTLSKCE